MSATAEKVDVYAVITNRIITQLESGVIPWQQTWATTGPPTNLISLRPYQGINMLLLASLGFNSNHFLSFKQLKDIGGSVRKGEKSCPVVFWSQKEPEEEGQKKRSFLRYYNVFNIEQCEDIPQSMMPKPLEERFNVPIEACEEVLRNMPNIPKVKHKGQEAYYSPANDFINMPRFNSFQNGESYYGTLFHELVHSTGHQSRLNRKEVNDPKFNFGTETYAVEELTAQIGACFLNSFVGIEEKLFENDVAYISHWLDVLKKDNRCIIYASSQAGRAVNFILNQNPAEDADDKD